MSVSKELSRGSTGYLVLSVLSVEDLYGYRIVKELEKRSENVFSLQEGTLYPVLHALEREGCLESYWADGQGARRRKYYHITDAGRRQLAAWAEEWKTYSGAVTKVLGGACLA